MSAATRVCMPLELGANRLCWLLQVAAMRRELRDPQTVLAGFVPSIEGVGDSDASKRSSLCVACCARARRVMSDNRAASCVSQPGSTALFVKNFLTCHRRCHSHSSVAAATSAVPGRRLWLLSFHNFISTYYAPLLFRPLAYLRGLRNLFGGCGWVCIVLCGGPS